MKRVSEETSSRKHRRRESTQVRSDWLGCREMDSEACRAEKQIPLHSGDPKCSGPLEFFASPPQTVEVGEGREALHPGHHAACPPPPTAPHPGFTSWLPKTRLLSPPGNPKGYSSLPTLLSPFFFSLKCSILLKTGRKVEWTPILPSFDH